MRSLRWKILLTCVAIVFIPIYLLNRHALEYFDWFARTDLERQLRHVAVIVGEQYRTLPTGGAPTDGPAGRDAFNRWLRRTANEMGGRIQILNTDGLVTHDSADPPEAGTDLRDRPEVAEAVTGAYSARARLTDDRRFMYFYIAQPIKDDARHTLAVAYVTRHSDAIMQAIRQMIHQQRVATGLALGLAALAALVLALTLTRRLRALRRAAKRYAAGAGPLDPPLRGRDEIAELDHAIHEMAAELETRHAYNREFVRTTLHELRTPLTAIRGAAELLRDGAGAQPDARARFLDNILHQTERLTRLVGELRDLTRLDAEHRAPPPPPADYHAFLRAAVARLEDTFPLPHAALRLELSESTPLVPFVPHRLEQVFSNLLDNAFRYTPSDGSVTIRVEPPRDGAVRTVVADNGCGISAENLPRIFERFFTTERRDVAAAHGSGLGLAIAQSIIHNHRGRIWAESEPGSGARLIFELPCPG